MGLLDQETVGRLLAVFPISAGKDRQKRQEQPEEELEVSAMVRQMEWAQAARPPRLADINQTAERLVVEALDGGLENPLRLNPFDRLECPVWVREFLLGEGRLESLVQIQQMEQEEREEQEEQEGLPYPAL